MRHRARREVDKHERRRALVAAAFALVDESSYEAVTMTKVAERAGLAKGTLYLYFGTKEDLFLSVAEQSLGEWFGALDAWLEDGDGPAEVGELAEVIASSLASRPALVRLLAILHTTLERNIDAGRVLSFKRFLLSRFGRTATLLERRLPFLAAGEGGQLLLRLDALVIGLWHLADPAPAVREVLGQLGMEPFVVDFPSELAAMVRALLAGQARRRETR
jgi:AcrR family transcriptional regulator